MGRVIRKGDVIRKTASINAELSNLLAAVQSTQKTFDKINAKETQLAGVAWKGFRTYVSQIQLPILDAYIYWTQVMTEANDKFSQAAGKLSAAVLDEDLLKESRNQYQRQIDHCNNSPLLAQNLGAHHCIVEYCYKMIKMIDKKIDEINAFDSETSGLFTDAESTLAVLERAKTEIGNVTFDSVLKTYNLSGISPEFRTKLDEIHGKKVLKDAGIDAEELEKLKAEGIYTQEEMANLIENCETAEDRTFVVDMLLKKYSEAFQINPNKLSVTSDYMMAEHAKRLYQADLLDNVVDINNAILASDKVYNTETIDGEIAGEGDIHYRDIYLGKMRDGMQVICGMEKEIMQRIPSTETVYSDMETRNIQNMKLLNMWETELVYIDKLKNKGPENLLKLRVDKPKEDNDLSTLEFTHYSGSVGKKVMDVICIVNSQQLKTGGIFCNDNPTEDTIEKKQLIETCESKQELQCIKKYREAVENNQEAFKNFQFQNLAFMNERYLQAFGEGLNEDIKNITNKSVDDMPLPIVMLKGVTPKMVLETGLVTNFQKNGLENYWKELGENARSRYRGEVNAGVDGLTSIFSIPYSVYASFPPIQYFQTIVPMYEGKKKETVETSPNLLEMSPEEFKAKYYEFDGYVEGMAKVILAESAASELAVARLGGIANASRTIKTEELITEISDELLNSTRIIRGEEEALELGSDLKKINTGNFKIGNGSSDELVLNIRSLEEEGEAVAYSSGLRNTNAENFKIGSGSSDELVLNIRSLEEEKCIAYQTSYAQSSEIVENIGGFNSYKKVNTFSAEETNQWFVNNIKPDYRPPYKPNTTVTEIELTNKETFVRVYDNIPDSSGKYGSWVMRAEDIEGLSPLEIQNKFALPNTPRYICDVELEAGTHIRMGEVNPLEGWGNGGGIQYDLMGQRIGDFINERLLEVK